VSAEEDWFSLTQSEFEIWEKLKKDATAGTAAAAAEAAAATPAEAEAAEEPPAAENIEEEEEPPAKAPATDDFEDFVIDEVTVDESTAPPEDDHRPVPIGVSSYRVRTDRYCRAIFAAVAASSVTVPFVNHDSMHFYPMGIAELEATVDEIPRICAFLPNLR
jgi:hypothetical protein